MCIDDTAALHMSFIKILYLITYPLRDVTFLFCVGLDKNKQTNNENKINTIGSKFLILKQKLPCTTR